MIRLSIKQKLIAITSILPVIVIFLGISSNIRFSKIEKIMTDVSMLRDSTTSEALRMTEAVSNFRHYSKVFFKTGNTELMNHAKDELKKLENITESVEFDRIIEEYRKLLELARIRYRAIDKQRKGLNDVKHRIMLNSINLGPERGASLLELLELISQDLRTPDIKVKNGLTDRLEAFIDSTDGELQYALEDLEDIWLGSNAVYFKLQKDISGKISNADQKLQNAYKKWLDTKRAAALRMENSINSIVATTERFILFICIIAIITGLAGIFLVIRSVANPLRAFISRVQELATGEADLTRQLEISTVECASSRKCGNTGCKCYGRKTACWCEAGSFSANPSSPLITSGRYSSCEQCKVYRACMTSELDRISFYFNRFIRRIRQIVQQIMTEESTLSGQSASLNELAARVSQSAAMVREQSEDTRVKINDTVERIHSTASVMEDMTATINTISADTAASSNETHNVAAKAEKSHRLIQELYEKSNEIEKIGILITNIASKTNLLALNASIEAARAGEAGKGFAVVANEVKELAKQTAESVDNINKMVAAIKESTLESLASIDEVVESTKEITGLSDSIASAVETQTATTNEVSATLQEISRTMQEVQDASIAMTDAGARNSEHAVFLTESAAKLGELAAELNKILSRFKV